MPRGIAEDQEGRKVYIGGIEADTTTEELESLFGKYGAISTVWVARNPPGFAFLTFEDYRDAKDAVAELDGYRFRGKPIRVEIARGPGDKSRGRRRFAEEDRRDGRGREDWVWHPREDERRRDDERRSREDYDRRRPREEDGRYCSNDEDHRPREDDYARRRDRSRSRSDERRRYDDEEDRRDRRRDYY